MGNIVNAKVTAFEYAKTLYVLRITQSGKNAVELYCDRADELDCWLSALSEMCVFTDIESDYKFLQMLGSGTYARVYSAVELDSGRHVAVKRISQKSPQNISSEITILREIRHPGIVQLLKVYENWKDTCLVLSLESGLSLQRYISGCGSLGESKVKELMRSLLETLVYLHGCGIVHRDIKPDNVIVDTQDGHLTCKLIDFGLAIRVTDMKEVNVCGTPGFIAPEILNQRAVDTQADIFSAGMLAYTALRGRNPFTHFDRKTTLNLNKRAQLSFNSPRWAKHSPSLLHLLTSMTSLEPAQRPTASECLCHPCFEESSDDFSCIPGRYSLVGTQASSSENSTNGDDRPPGADFSPVP